MLLGWEHGFSTRAAVNHSAIRASTEALHHIRRAAILQLVGISQWATDSGCRACLQSIISCVQERFTVISELAESARIRPLSRIALTEGERPAFVEEQPLRIGVYPLAANPLHWGHILVGLTAIASLELDKIVYLVAGRDPRKPSLLPEETRHHLARSVIESYEPLFAYSPLARGTELDGETNLGVLLKLNARQPMDVFYIAGADHYRRSGPDGEPDTLWKLERVVEVHRKAGRTLQSIAAAFVERPMVNVQRQNAATSLAVHVIPAIPLSFSSTAARNALCREEFSEPLVSLPYSCLLQIRTEGLYVGTGECIEDPASPE